MMLPQIDGIHAWLVAGLLLLVAEAAGLTGAGLMFAGLGAVITGMAVYLSLIGDDQLTTQFVVFFVASAVSALVLWKPLQKRLHGKPRYQNIVGQTAYVGSNGITKEKGGEVTWSGTIMKAQLGKHVSLEMLEAGSLVTVTEISGNTLIVEPKE